MTSPFSSHPFLTYILDRLRGKASLIYSANVKQSMLVLCCLFKVISSLAQYNAILTAIADTPSVKIKYTASVTSVLPVLLSAIRQYPPSDGPAHDGKIVGKDAVTYIYHQPVPIPSYLIAIASGNVVYRGFKVPPGRSWSSGLWAEPELIDAAFWEFSEDTCRYLAKEEDIVTSYRFGVYDLLVLPPSFPYGGMENACLTFLTSSKQSVSRVWAYD